VVITNQAGVANGLYDEPSSEQTAQYLAERAQAGRRDD